MTKPAKVSKLTSVTTNGKNLKLVGRFSENLMVLKYSIPHHVISMSPIRNFELQLDNLFYNNS